MSFEEVKKFFRDLELWKQVVAGVLIAIIIGFAAFFKWIFKGEGQPPPDAPIKVVNITAEPGATINITVIDYQNGLNQTAIPEVKSLFEKGRAHYINKEFHEAIDKFKACLKLEKGHEKLGALNLQIANCYYELRSYLRAAEFYAAGLREARKANDVEGEASNLLNIANTYLLRPASNAQKRGRNVLKAVEHYGKALQIFLKDEYPVQYATTQNNLGTAYKALPAATPEQRAENVRKAVECYQAALEIYKKDEYPVQYATTQNNLGTAYKALPAATPQQRAENVRKAIECYQAALEFRRKDEYPQDYCFTAANIGMILASINDTDACHWLREAYALREFLPDQGKRLEKLMEEVCN